MSVVRAAVPLVLVAFLVASTAAGAGSPSTSSRLPPRAGLQDLGPAPASTTVRVVVQLALRHNGELEALIKAQGDASSPMYRRFLTRSQFVTYFSPTLAAYARARALLERAGFTIERTYATRLTIDASAPAPLAERYFRTRIDRVAEAGAGVRYANVTPVTMPTELDGLVEAVDGLSDLVLARASARQAADAPHAVGVASPLAGSPILNGPDGGFSPIALSLAYDLPALHGATGSGFTVADIIDGAVNDGYVGTYLAAFNLTRTGPPARLVTVDGGCGTHCFDNVVADFDAESVLGQALGATLYTYELPTLDNKSIEDGFAQVVADASADVVVTSFGACETLVAPQGRLVDLSQKAGTALGMTFVSVGAGELGSAGAYACGTSSPPAVQAPEDGQYDLGVGGTDVVSNRRTGSFERQRGDNDSGGGVSVLSALPFYQFAIARQASAHRNLPDIVSAAAIDDKGPSWFSNGWVGGNPFPSAAPIAGVIATLDQTHGGRLGLLNTELYALSARGSLQQGKRLFRDVTRGCNGLAPRSPPYCAGDGYDLVTGIGSIDGENLAQAIR
jgi:subtilase family serine protease